MDWDAVLLEMAERAYVAYCESLVLKPTWAGEDPEEQEAWVAAVSVLARPAEAVQDHMRITTEAVNKALNGRD